MVCARPLTVQFKEGGECDKEEGSCLSAMRIESPRFLAEGEMIG